MYDVNRKAAIITRNVFPPIPDRRFDWCAYHEGDEETQHCGWGPTEKEAIADLRRLDDEWADVCEAEQLEAAQSAE